MNDYAPAGTAGKSTTRTMTGYHVGAVATAFLALLVVPNWRIMFVVGGLAGFALVPFLWFRLPETLPAVLHVPRRPSHRGAPGGTLPRSAQAAAPARGAEPGSAPASATWPASLTRWWPLAWRWRPSWDCCWSTA